jgi:hypothetical protein
MNCVLTSALFTLSIDLELDPLRPSRDQPRSLETITDRLVRLLDRYHASATWAVADPAVSAATEFLLAANESHEIAILGDQTWVGHEAGRMRFGRELARRVIRGRAAGIPISTLALRGTELADHLDLVAKQEILAVRDDFHEIAKGWLAKSTVRTPAALRFGLWDVPASMRLPGTSRWKLGGGGRRRCRSGIDKAIAECSVFHIQIDALSLADRGSMAEHALEQILRHAAIRQQQGALEITTIAGVARKLMGERTTAPARSILHPAA